ncbi:hypothetical protein GCM10008983_05010 [Lentibacillus halophilus]|uniref:Yip1 domain-containing protein n=1 Tax=Lentibacillus halophilus TaxID=295065 RepID=A0ABN0Z3W4_9BACI
MPTNSDADHYETNDDFVEKLKEIGTNVVHFCGALLKRPSIAKKANHTDIVSAAIVMALFALIIAFSYYFVIQYSILASFYMNVSIIDSLVLPFIVFILLQLIMAGITFAGAKLAAQAVTFADVLAKYGAYLVPFAILYVVALVFSLIGLSVLAGLFIFISILGLLMMVPTFILMEQTPEGIDRIYILLGLYALATLVFGVFIRAFAQSMIGNIMGSMLGGF